MYRYKTYTKWISTQKVVSFVDFLINQEQNGSSIPISFTKFLEMPGPLFSVFFSEKYIWDEIQSNKEVYRDFINKVEAEFLKDKI